MSAEELLIGLVVVLITSVLVLTLTIRQRRSAVLPVFRRIAALSKFKRAVSLSVEEGTRIHVSLGNASLTQPASASAFVSLIALRRITQLSSAGDNPPVATAGDSVLAILSQDTLHQVARETHTLDLYDPSHGSLAGVTPLSYVCGALQEMNDPDVKTNVLVGNYGSEVGFLSTSSEDKGAYTLAASDSLPAQSVLYATTIQPLIGEELFALPAYLHPTPAHTASLQVQDLLRGLVVLVILCGSILKLLGVV
ncbi:MAG: DUF6754 domain-containing protein [Anaerolineaceae bacterium]